MNGNVQSVATFATTVNATQDGVVSTLAARYLLPHEKVRKLSKAPTHLDVLSIVDELRNTGCPYTFRDVVPLDVEQSLVTLLQRQYCNDRSARDDCESWKSWTTERFCKELLKAVPDESIDTPLGEASFLEQVSSFNFRFDLNNIDVDDLNDKALGTLIANFPSTTAEEQLKAVKIMERQLPTHPINWQLILYRAGYEGRAGHQGKGEDPYQLHGQAAGLPRFCFVAVCERGRGRVGSGETVAAAEAEIPHSSGCDEGPGYDRADQGGVCGLSTVLV